MHAFPALAKRGEAGAAAFLGEVLPVVHLHGLLGGQDTVLRGGPDRSPFMHREFFEHAASRIRIVHENESTKEYKLAQTLLREARVVHLLGFGFHATNVGRLDLATQAKKRGGWETFGGTALGLEAAERARAEAALKLGRNILQPLDCLSYLRGHAALR
jgi:hypothetical protein